MKSIFKNLNLLIKIIGWMQIVGGVVGLGLMASIMVKTETISGIILFLFLTGLSLFIFSIYCGTTLLSKNTVYKGLILSLFNQALQFVQWCLFGYGLSYSAPLQFLIGIKGSLSFDFNMAIASTFNMSFNTSDDYFLKINLIAILVFIILLKIYRRLKLEDAGVSIIAIDESLSVDQEVLM
jgi:hypothetical protein